ncbi:putative transposase y4qJ (plasmid) [Rhizobium sp. CCGE 510]|nr:putative transposase y4qJ [Rhizobium sp. CCGE 510]
MRPTFEVADIFRRHGGSYRRENAGHLGRAERRVMGAIEACRTPRSGDTSMPAMGAAGPASPITPAAIATARSVRGCSQRVGRRTHRRSLAGPILPCGLHPASGRRRDRLPEQGGRLCIADADLGRDAADDRRQFQMAGRRGRRHRRASPLGPGDDPPSPCPLRRTGWRSLAGQVKVDQLPIGLFSTRSRAVTAVSAALSDCSGGSLRPG